LLLKLFCMFHIDFNINEISITNGAKAYIIKLYRFWCPVVCKIVLVDKFAKSILYQ